MTAIWQRSILDGGSAYNDPLEKATATSRACQNIKTASDYPSVRRPSGECRLRSQLWNLLKIGVVVTQRIPAPSEVLTSNEP